MEEKELIIHLKIVSPDKTIYAGNVYSVLLPGAQGEFEVRPLHTPFISKLKIGIMQIYLDEESKEPLIFSIHEGYCRVVKDHLLILTHSSEKIDEIDPERAREAMERAEQRIEEAKPDTDLQRARVALARAMNRLLIVEKFKSALIDS